MTTETKITWPTATERKLIALVKAIPTLWDSRTEEYRVAENKMQHWLQIADELQSSVGKCCRVSIHFYNSKFLQLQSKPI